MPKNILIFADGTGQAGGVKPDQQLSNIYKLFRATRVGPDSPIDPKEQVAFYDPGLGTTTETGILKVSLWQRLKGIGGLAFGLGFSANVIDCYEAILKRYEPGDRIFLFGFSRGGYTVRSVANVLNLCGVPTTDGEGAPLPRAGKRLRAIATEAVVKVYEHGAGSPRAKFEAQREALARRFRAKYSAGTDPNRGDVVPEFIGVFDSVAALGLPTVARVLLAGLGVAVLTLVSCLAGWIGSHWSDAIGWTAFGLILAGGLFGVGGAYLRTTLRWVPADLKLGGPRCHIALWTSKHYDSFLDPRVPQARHALAIDETRTHFSRVKWGGKRNQQQSKEERFQQRWFAGNHSDIGGSYPEEESRLSDIALTWMVGEARSLEHPIQIDPSKLHIHPDHQGPQHCEIFAQRQGMWLPSFARWPRAVRYIVEDAVLDPSVIERFEATSILDCDRRVPYRPEALRMHVQVARYYQSLANQDAGDAGSGQEPVLEV